MKKSKILSEIKLGNQLLKNRFVMSPMTRCRADNEGRVGELTVLYYTQRASAGLLITEGTFPSPYGKGYTRTPGIVTEEQVQAWKKVTSAVHQAGGKIFLQIMHCGRIANPVFFPDKQPAVAPSAVKADTVKTYTDDKGLIELPAPRALETAEIPKMIESYKTATQNARKAGFDGVELHSASGYLPMQFLSTGTNLRTDQYGGSVANRCRFVLETLEAMRSVAGSSYVGIKISPGMQFNDISDANPQETYTFLVKELNPLNLAYLHVGDFKPGFDVHGIMRSLYKGVYLAGGGFDFERGDQFIEQNKADMIVYGNLFISNPDLPKRFESGAKLTSADPNTFYSPGAKGYTDYPFLAF